MTPEARETQRLWRLANPEKEKAYRRNDYQKQLTKMRSEYAVNPEKFKTRSQQWRLNNPEKAKALDTLARDRKFGKGACAYLTAQAKDQNNCCAICLRPFVKSPCLDHNHETQQWRGALCQMCNQALGLFGENILRLQGAIDYLNFWNGD